MRSPWHSLVRSLLISYAKNMKTHLEVGVFLNVAVKCSFNGHTIFYFGHPVILRMS